MPSPSSSTPSSYSQDKTSRLSADKGDFSGAVGSLEDSAAGNKDFGAGCSKGCGVGRRHAAINLNRNVQALLLNLSLQGEDSFVSLLKLEALDQLFRSKLLSL